MTMFYNEKAGSEEVEKKPELILEDPGLILLNTLKQDKAELEKRLVALERWQVNHTLDIGNIQSELETVGRNSLLAANYQKKLILDGLKPESGTSKFTTAFLKVGGILTILVYLWVEAYYLWTTLLWPID